MTIKELANDLRICASRDASCYGCTNYSFCTLGGKNSIEKNRSMLLENSADLIEAFMKLCEIGAFKIDDYYPYEINNAMINELCEAFEEKPF